MSRNVVTLLLTDATTTNGPDDNAARSTEKRASLVELSSHDSAMLEDDCALAVRFVGAFNVLRAIIVTKVPSAGCARPSSGWLFPSGLTVAVHANVASSDAITGM